ARGGELLRRDKPRARRTGMERARCDQPPLARCTARGEVHSIQPARRGRQLHSHGRRLGLDVVDRSHRRVFRDADPSQEPQTLVGGRTIDLQYRQRRQITDLLAASDILGVPAAYALYCGPISYRQDLPCGPTHKPTDDDRCHRSGVCVLPALSAMEFLELAEFANDPARMAIDAYEWATPLEDLVDPRRGPHRVHDPRLSIANADLRSFLLQPQPLPMSIAKKIFHTVSRLRQVKASAAPP